MPYEPDISAALRRLREEVFAKGEYRLGVNVESADVNAALEVCGSSSEAAVREMEARASNSMLPEQTRRKFAVLLEQMRQGSPAPTPSLRPTTIEELLTLAGENGTHSILDIVEVSRIPKFGAVTALPTTVLGQVFGGLKPSRGLVEAKIATGALEKYTSDRWHGIYIVIYEGESPDAILFAGCSGD